MGTVLSSTSIAHHPEHGFLICELLWPLCACPQRSMEQKRGLRCEVWSHLTCAPAGPHSVSRGAMGQG